MSITEIKKLRLQTGAGILDCKKALKESQQDFTKAIKWLKKKGISKAIKKSLRVAKEGSVSSYIHGNGRIGVLLEVNIETDFAARSADFKTFTHQLCLHIVAMNPLYVRREEVSEAEIQEETLIFTEQLKKEGKKPVIIQKIIEGKINKWFSEICLQEQIFLMTAQSEEPKTVEASIKDMVTRLGENIVINRFVRFELGEEPLKPLEDRK